MQTSSQYPRLVTPVRLVKHPSAMPRGWGTVLQKCRCAELTRVQLNDQGFVDVCTELVAVRRLLERAFSLVGRHFHPCGETDLTSQLQGFDDTSLLLGLFTHGDHVTHLRSEERRVGKECRSRWSPYH